MSKSAALEKVYDETDFVENQQNSKNTPNSELDEITYKLIVYSEQVYGERQPITSPDDSVSRAIVEKMMAKYSSLRQECEAFLQSAGINQNHGGTTQDDLEEPTRRAANDKAKDNVIPFNTAYHERLDHAAFKFNEGIKEAANWLAITEPASEFKEYCVAVAENKIQYRVPVHLPD